MLELIDRLIGGRTLDAAGPSEAAPEVKRSALAPLIALSGGGQAVWTGRDYAGLAREGFQKNPIVYRCVRMVSEAASSVPWLIYEGEEELEDHPILDLLERPNGSEDGASFFETVFGHLQVSGNAYLEACTLDGEVRELHALRPDRMQVVPGADGWPEGYEYRVGAERIRFDQTVEGTPPILHLKLFHALDDHYGLSPLEAAAQSLDLHNAASGWNKALLDNAARPSGALVYTGPEGQGLSKEQHDRLKQDLEESFQGAMNAGRPLLLEGGLDWKALSMSPKEMDFQEARNGAARDIALAFGVPPMLLGIPGDNTYANYHEANRALWRQTVVPLINRTAKALTRWLAPAERRLRLGFDLDAVDALSHEREAVWSRVEKASFLTEDEKRAAVGYGPKPQEEQP
ncbi:MAG: phage portal protein [Pseudomonadota bacterium]